jgi:glycosyltransferase involved in cell wall biosynthesis
MESSLGDGHRLSVIIPAKNEVSGLSQILPRIRSILPESEIVVVDDGSTQDQLDVCCKYSARRVVHPYSMGNGAAVKSGARAATGDIFVFMDGDGQHDPEDIPRLLAGLKEGYSMMVGARNGASQANWGRSWANAIYNRLASWMVGKRVSDLTSGFRAVTAARFREFIHLLPNGFSYPTTITMSFFRAGYPVGYIPIRTKPRIGKSHINPLRDGVRFFLIIFRVGTLYSPLKIFLPISVLNFAIGVSYYAYTFYNYGRFTNMSALLFVSSLLIFLIGLVSEQITMLLYRDRDH